MTQNGIALFMQETASQLSSRYLSSIEYKLHGVRGLVTGHEIYSSLVTLDALRHFMEHHVFAVWDFMSLLKALQINLTCARAPWYPPDDLLAARLVNEIVLSEETDLIDGEITSHFQLYLRAMEECGADTSAIGRFVNRISSGETVSVALIKAQVPPGPSQFVQTTMDIIDSGSVHTIAGAFSFGREDVIPEMFLSFVETLNQQFPGKLKRLIRYFERHIELDGRQHGTMARQVLESLCGDDVGKWSEVERAATTALQARVGLWDSALAAVRAT